MHPIFISKITAIAMLALGIIAQSALAQSSAISIPVSVAASATPVSNSNNAPGSLQLSLTGLPTSDYPDGQVIIASPAVQYPLYPVATGDNSYPTKQFANILPGKVYSVSIHCVFVQNVTFTVNPPAGYRAEINGQLCTSYTTPGLFSPQGDVVFTFRVFSPSEVFSGRAGESTSLSNGRIDWQVALGNLKSGKSAGSIALVDAASDATWSNVFTPAGLSYQAHSPEIYVYRENGSIRQVVSNEAFVDVITLSSVQTCSYELRFYPVDRAPIPQSPAPLYPRTASGFPYVTYRIAQDVTNPTMLTITCETRDVSATPSANAPSNSTVIGVTSSAPAIKRTSVTTLSRTGTSPNYSWKLQDWYTLGKTALVEEQRSWSSSAGVRQDIAQLRVPNSSTNAGYAITAFSQNNWGETLTSVTRGSDSASQIVTQYNYWPTSSSIENYGAISSIYTAATGAWQAFEYLPSSYGVILRKHSPYLNSPSSPPSSLATDNQGVVTSYSYASDAFGRFTRPLTIITTINDGNSAKIVSSATITYTDPLVANGMNIVKVTRSDQTNSSGAVLQTITQYYREDTGDDFYSNQLHSVLHSDGTQQSYAYQRGNWDAATSVFTTNSAGTGTASRIIVVNGTNQTTGNSACPSVDNYYTIEPIYLVANKSTKQIYIRDKYAHLVHVEANVWTGFAWSSVPVVSQDYTYDSYSNLLVGQKDNISQATQSAIYTGDQKGSETDSSGITLSYTYDDAGRISTVAKTNGPTTTYDYDAASRITSQTLSGGTEVSIVASRVYDDAGRIKSESQPGANGSMVTGYEYDTGVHTVTIKAPDTGKRVIHYNADGSTSLIDGSGVIPEYFTYGVASDGTRSVQVNLGSSNSARYRKNTADLLGRTTQTIRPGFSGQPDIVEGYTYEAGTGRLISSSLTGYANTIYEYDALSQVIRSGLDVGGNGTLDMASSDRISDTDQFFENYQGSWWLTKVLRTYPTKDNNTPLTLTTVRQRLTGFSSNQRSETVSTDVNGNVTTTSVTVDTGSATTTISTTTTGISGIQTQTIVNGLTTSLVTAEGITYESQYDLLERPWKRKAPGSGATATKIETITTYYSGTAMAQYVSAPTDLTSTPNIIATYSYDNMGRVVGAKNAAGKNSFAEYNTLGQLIHQWGDTTYPVNYEYDTYGALQTESTYRGGSGWTASSWPSGTVGTPDSTTWAYDPASGLVTSKRDAKNQSVTFLYNNRGQVSQRKWARGVYTYYQYDPATGELTSKTYSDTTTPAITYSYNRTGLLNTVDDSTGPSGTAVTSLRTFVYNSINPYELDAVNLSTFYASRIQTRSYDSIKRPNGFTLGDSSRGLQADLSHIQSYDLSTGRLSNLVTAMPGSQSDRTFQYGYTAGGLVSSLSASGTGFSVARSYELYRNLLSSISSTGPAGLVTQFDYTYNALGQRQSAKQVGTAGSGAFGDFLSSTFYWSQYNDRGELTSSADYLGEDITNKTTQLSGRNFTYQYDSLGNRTSAARTGGQDPGTTDSFLPNELNQIVSRDNKVAHVAGTVADSTVTVTVSAGLVPSSVGRQGGYWDAQVALSNSNGPASSTVSITAAAPGGSPSASDTTKMVLLPAFTHSFEYDLDGNMTKDGIWNYTYDAENRLTQMTSQSAAINAGYPSRTVDFKYDYLNRRVQKHVNNAGTESYRRYLYDGWNLVAEFDAPSGSSCGTMLRSYAWGLDLAGSLSNTGGVGALLQITDYSNNASYLPTFDGNGNVAALANAADGSIVAAYEYSPFGELLRCQGTYARTNPFRFSTKFTDDETGLVYYGHRYYSPSLGRFTNRDPIEEAGGVNLYGFCGNDPINAFDYMGLNPTFSAGVGSWAAGSNNTWIYTDTLYTGTNPQKPDGSLKVTLTFGGIGSRVPGKLMGSTFTNQTGVASQYSFDCVQIGLGSFTINVLDKAGKNVYAASGSVPYDYWHVPTAPSGGNAGSGGSSGGNAGSSGNGGGSTGSGTGATLTTTSGAVSVAPNYGEITAYNDGGGSDPIPLTFRNVAAVGFDAIGKSVVGASLFGSDQIEGNSGRSQVIGSGYQALRSNLGDQFGVPVNNPRFGLASDLSAAIGMYAAAAELTARSTSLGIKTYYPINNGALGRSWRQWLMPGDLIDRYGGSPISRFFSPTGTIRGARSLPPGTSNVLRRFIVRKPFEVDASMVAPAYGELGFGTQLVSPVELQILLKRGIIEEIH